MPWSLDYQPVQHPELLDEFFLALGKALYLATEYEAKCDEYLRFIQLADAIQDGHDLDAAFTLVNHHRAHWA